MSLSKNKNSEMAEAVLKVVEDMKIAASIRRNVGERSTAAHLDKWASMVKSAVMKSK